MVTACRVRQAHLPRARPSAGRSRRPHCLPVPMGHAVWLPVTTTPGPGARLLR